MTILSKWLASTNTHTHLAWGGSGRAAPAAAALL